MQIGLIYDYTVTAMNKSRFIFN